MTSPSFGTVKGHAPDRPSRRHDAQGAPLRLLHVHAHPDDESSKGAATTAKYVADGVEVMVVTCTGGERGDVLNPQMDRPEVWENIAEIRAKEMDAARDILGIEQTWLGFVDSGLPEGDPMPPLPEGCFALVDDEVATEALVKVIRGFRPQVMTTYDEFGGYPHPDHIKTHVISMAAFEAAGDPERFPDAGEPWQVGKIYYHMTFTKDRITSLDRACHEDGIESPYAEWIKNWGDDRPDMGPRVTTKVECADYFGVRDDALRAHATQIDPDGRWFAIPLEVQRRAWPTEDFELAASHVETTLPETDLFAGIAVEGE